MGAYAFVRGAGARREVSVLGPAELLDEYVLGGGRRPLRADTSRHTPLRAYASATRWGRASARHLPRVRDCGPGGGRASARRLPRVRDCGPGGGRASARRLPRV